jgi:tripartite-type tricarboxylate transporter receptor subunit TctC
MRKISVLFTLFLFALFSSGAASAQDTYPSKPVKIIIPSGRAATTWSPGSSRKVWHDLNTQIQVEAGPGRRGVGVTHKSS